MTNSHPHLELLFLVRDASHIQGQPKGFEGVHGANQPSPAQKADRLPRARSPRLLLLLLLACLQQQGAQSQE